LTRALVSEGKRRLPLPSPQLHRIRRHRLRLALPAALLATLLASCNDSVTCVFTTGCQGGGSGAISDDAAALPLDGQWILDGPPEVTDVFPTETGGFPGTVPVVLVFSESMSAESLAGAFELVPIPGGIPDLPLDNVGAALVAEGRVLILRPPELDQGDYQVRVAPDAVVTDLTGQRLKQDPGVQLGTFTVLGSPADEPALLAAFPLADSVNQSDSGEIVVVFDRPVRAATVDDASFIVTVDGAEPVSDPTPLPLVVEETSGPVQDLRVYTWQSVDPQGLPLPLGGDALVRVVLSPLGAPILDEDNDILPGTDFQFRTLALAPPLSARLASAPDDAIGLANLTDGDPRELLVEVQLEAGEPGDALDLFLFGQTKAAQPQLIALLRMINLEGAAPIESATFTREEIALQLSSDPADTRVADGAVAFAFRSRRAALVTPVRVLDVEPLAGGVTDPLLDTSAPEIVDVLVPSGQTALYRSDQRGIALAGHADEELRAAEVVTPLGDNGPLAPVIGSDARGLFQAAPVPAGVLPGGTTSYTLTVYDAALNPSASVSGTFEQLGAVGPDPLTLDGTLEVEVFDERTLTRLSGANVLLHADLGNGVDFPFRLSSVTQADGRVALGTAGVPAGGAIVTVERVGYDLFTFHGVGSTRLSVPLRRSGLQEASRAAGELFSSDPGVVAFLGGLDRRIDDGRRAGDLPRGFATDICGGGAGTIACSYGPEPIRAGRLGARTAFVGDFSLTGASFSAALLVQGFAFAAPLGPALAGVEDERELELPFLLTDARTPPEEAALELPAAILRVDPGSGVDTGNLDDDPVTTGVPFVSVETLVPGLPGAVAVGSGLAFDLSPERWLVRSGQPGAVSPSGSLGSTGVVDGDPFVRMELRDMAGNASGVRPRSSTIAALGPQPEFAALPVAEVSSPLPGAHTGGQAFTVALRNAIDDGRAEDGLYRVELAERGAADPRRWTLWRADPPGSGPVHLRVVDVGDAGLVGLDDGDLEVRSAAFAWAGLDPLAFLWSDVEREPDLFSFSAPITIQKP
jgi:hypothetical protein